MATLPPEWRLMDVVCGRAKLILRSSPTQCVAWACGPNGERVDGQADSAQGALDALANAMRKSGQAFKVD
jgi:hypothetical protein